MDCRIGGGWNVIGSIWKNNMIGRYKNKLDGSILEVYQVKVKKEVRYVAKWVQSQTKQGLEFDLTDNFNKFLTFEKL